MSVKLLVAPMKLLGVLLIVPMKLVSMKLPDMLLPVPMKLPGTPLIVSTKLPGELRGMPTVAIFKPGVLSLLLPAVSVDDEDVGL